MSQQTDRLVEMLSRLQSRPRLPLPKAAETCNQTAERISDPGRNCEVTSETYYWYLECLPPRWQDGGTFCHAEGEEPFRLFWHEGQCFFCRQMTREETVQFCELAGLPPPIIDVLIHSYTREQAIADGVLVDVTETAKEASFKFPVAVTQAVWQRYVAVPEGVTGQDEQGRLWDVLWMLLIAIQGQKTDCAEILYMLYVRNSQEGAPDEVTLKSVCGPGDNAEPVITIMLPDED